MPSAAIIRYLKVGVNYYGWGVYERGTSLKNEASGTSVPETPSDFKHLLAFHERLNGVIILWATMIDALLQVDTHECYTLAFALLDLQPDARYVDHVMLRTESEVRNG